MHDVHYETLKASIAEGVAKGVPVDFITYSLERAGWPRAMVRDAVDTWMRENGRWQKRTDFKHWLARYYRQARSGVILTVTLYMIADGIALLQPWPLKILADSAFGNLPAPGPLKPYTHTPTLILIVSLMTLGIFLLGQAFGIFKDFLQLKISYWLNRNIKEEAFRHILHLPLYHKERLPKGDYFYRLDQLTNSLSDLALETTAEIASSAIMLVGVLVIMLMLNVKLTIISLVVVPFLILSIKVFGPIMGRYGMAFTKINSQTAALINESLDNGEIIQAFSLAERQVGRLKDLWMQTYNIARKGMVWGKAFSFSDGLVVILGTSLTIYFGGSAALKGGSFSLGDLLIFMTYLGYLMNPIESITSQITMRRQKIMNVHRVYEVLGDHEGIEHLRENKPLVGRVAGRIDFQNVTYQYGDKIILDQMNLTVMPGERVGIIGPSGTGKTSLLRLLDLYEEPTMGRILIDGVDIQTVSLRDLRRQIAWISQTPQLFSTTIVDNMRDGDIERAITPEELAWAAKASNVSEVAARLPMGLDTLAGEGGASLSGGERQRIAIARGLLKNTPIICMDEPTAALDDKSEQLIVDSIGALIEKKTVLLVTHRFPLLKLMNKIFVLREGRLIDVNQLGGLQAYAQTLQGQSEV